MTKQVGLELLVRYTFILTLVGFPFLSPSFQKQRRGQKLGKGSGKGHEEEEGKRSYKVIPFRKRRPQL